MNNAIDHPEAAQLVDSLVASEGGHFSYGLGVPGRKIAVAAGAQLAAHTGMPLTVIDFRHMLPQIHATVAELHPDLASTPMSVGEAVQHPERNTDGVLVMNIDLLRDTRTRATLLARAAAADRLIVASQHIGTGEPVRNSLPGLRFTMRDLSAVPRSDSGVAGIRESKERLIRQIEQEAPSAHDPVRFEGFDVSSEELAKAVQNANPDELRRRIARLQDQQGQRTAAHSAPQQTTHDHGQAQSAVYQQQDRQSPGLT